MVVVGVIFFSLFLGIDGQSLQLRGPAINCWLFFYLNINIFNHIKQEIVLVFQELLKNIVIKLNIIIELNKRYSTTMVKATFKVIAFCEDININIC